MSGIEIPTTEPTELVAGDTLRWTKSLPDFPATAGWQLSYALRGPSDLVMAWGTRVSADGAGFSVLVPATATNLTPGTYTLWRYVTDGTLRHSELVNASFQVHANPTADVSTKSFNVRMLEAIEARLEDAADSSDELSISINGRSVTYRTREELEGERAHYAHLVQLERNPDGRIVHQAHFVG